MDDLSVACSIDLRKDLRVDDVKRERPLQYSERTEQILPLEFNPLIPILEQFEAFTITNKMKINSSKTKIMKFTRTKSLDFPLEISFSNKEALEEVTSFKLLGVIVSNTLKWQDNTDYICSKARKKIWLLRNMKKSGLSTSELLMHTKRKLDPF